MKSALLAGVFALGALSANAQTTLFSDDFENGLGKWTVANFQCGTGCSSTPVSWHPITAPAPCAAVGGALPSGIRAVRFGHPTNCDYDGGPTAAPNAALVTLTPIALPASAGSITLRIRSLSRGEDDHLFDRRRVCILAGPLIELQTLYDSIWADYAFDLTPWAGSSVTLWFEFATGDAISNSAIGWYIDDVRVIASPDAAAAYCLGDATSGTNCPCANFGQSGHGCASSTNPNGALLSVFGSASLSAGTVRLDATGLNPSFAALAQGSAQAGHGHGFFFGDGLLCIEGVIKRIVTRLAVGGNLSYPEPGDAALSIAGGPLQSGNTRVYQVWYRNASAFCTPATYNSTNALTMTWRP